MPLELVGYLKNEIQDDFSQECGKEKAHIIESEYYELNNHNLIMFLCLPDYLCNSSNSFVPVVVDKEGRWSWGKRIPGIPTTFVEDQEHTLWLITQWAIEASYPTLYRSKNGLEWKEISLPENRNVDCCFEFVREICFENNRIRLRFEGNFSERDDSFELNEDYLYAMREEKTIPETIIAKLEKIDFKCQNVTKEVFIEALKGMLSATEFAEYKQKILLHANKIKYWSANIDNIMKEPVWKRIHNEDIDNKKCKSYLMRKGEWFRQDNESEIHFLYAPNNLILIFQNSI